MRAMKVLLSVSFSLLVLLTLGGCATANYVPKANEELYGTWTNENQRFQKLVNLRGGFKMFSRIDGSDLFEEGTLEIEARWIDSEGSVWYKTF